MAPLLAPCGAGGLTSAKSTINGQARCGIGAHAEQVVDTPARPHTARWLLEETPVPHLGVRSIALPLHSAVVTV